MGERAKSTTIARDGWSPSVIALATPVLEQRGHTENPL
jgi:hypothetical protein